MTLMYKPVKQEPQRRRLILGTPNPQTPYVRAYTHVYIDIYVFISSMRRNLVQVGFSSPKP